MVQGQVALVRLSLLASSKCFLNHTQTKYFALYIYNNDDYTFWLVSVYKINYIASPEKNV